MSKFNEDAGVPSHHTPGILVFTDGSKDNKTTATGVGIVIYESGLLGIENRQEQFTYSTRLRSVNSVFQTEVWGILKASQLLLELLEKGSSKKWIKEGTDITFYSDSQSALKAINSDIFLTFGYWFLLIWVPFRKM